MMTIPAVVGLTNLPTATMTDEQLLENVGGHLQLARSFARRNAEETWAVGRGLFFLRDRRRKEGAWLDTVEKLGISPACASYLVKIGMAFATVDDVRGREVEDLKVMAGVYSKAEIERRLAKKAAKGASEPEVITSQPQPTTQPTRKGTASAPSGGDPDQEIAAEVNRLIEKVALLLTRVSGLKSRKGIDLGKLKQTPGDLRKIVKMVEKLPEVAA